MPSGRLLKPVEIHPDEEKNIQIVFIKNGNRRLSKPGSRCRYLLISAFGDKRLHLISLFIQDTAALVVIRENVAASQCNKQL